MDTASFWQILAAGIASALIGMLWYHPRAFGSLWMRLTNITPEMAERGKRRMPIYALLGVMAAMGIAWVMNSFGVALGIYDWVGAIFKLALLSWLGFVVPTMLSQVLWEHRPMQLYLITIGYWLVSFCAIALILLL